MLNKVLVHAGIQPGRKIPNGYTYSEAPKKPGLWDLYQVRESKTDRPLEFIWEPHEKYG